MTRDAMGRVFNTSLQIRLFKKNIVIEFISVWALMFIFVFVSYEYLNIHTHTRLSAFLIKLADQL